jgi:hypothetical protein
LTWPELCVRKQFSYLFSSYWNVVMSFSEFIY